MWEKLQRGLQGCTPSLGFGCGYQRGTSCLQDCAHSHQQSTALPGPALPCPPHSASPQLPHYP